MYNKRTIIFAVIICVVLFILYNMSIRHVISGWGIRSDNQWSRNIIVAEEFIYRSNTPHTVLVGTSLTTRFKANMFTGDVYNLAFGGKSTFDGLRILELSTHTPALVLVETNFLFKQGDPSFTDSLFQQPIFIVKEYFPALTERYRPLNDLRLAVPMFVEMFHGKIHELLTGSPQKENIKSERPLVVSEKKEPIASTNPLFEFSLKKHVTNNNKALSNQVVHDTILQFKMVIDKLRNRGMTVVLFELPMHPRVCNALRINQIRQAISLTFPSEQYYRLVSPDCNEYQTTDGIHLPSDEARRFATEIFSELSRNELLRDGLSEDL